MTALATYEDYAALHRASDLDNDEVTLIENLLGQASARVRNHCRQMLSLVTDDAVEIAGTWAHVLELPERPIVDVTAVSVNGFAVSTNDFSLTTTGIRWGGASADYDHDHNYPAESWPPGAAGGQRRNWAGPDAVVAVTYSHGFATIPDDVIGVVVNLVDAALNAPERATQRLAIGSYSETFNGDARALTADEMAILDRYRR